MSFFPPSFNPRDEVVGVLTLANINTADGDFGFLIGQDGKFTDIDGKDWWGSTLIDSPEIEMPINGVAPNGQITLSWFDDPTRRVPGVSLIAQIRALGADYVRDRALTFHVQPLTDRAQLWAPVLAPIPFAQVRMQSIAFSLSGATQRSITLSWEGAFAGRNTARGLYYTTTDHARLTGAANPSLTYAPMDNRQPEKLF